MLQKYTNITAILGSIPSKHPLVKIAPIRPEFVDYVDRILGKAREIIERLPSSADQIQVLRNKLCDVNGFYAAIAEMETLIHLSEAKFEVSIEPLWPARGPDFLIKDGTFSSFVEVRSIGPDEYEMDMDLTFDYLRTKLAKIETRYVLYFKVPVQFVAYSKELKKAVNKALNVLDDITAADKDQAALYYFSPDDYYVANKNLHFATYDLEMSDEELNWQNRAVQAGVFSVDFQRQFDEPKTGMFTLGDEARWLQPQDRIHNVLKSKIDQLVKGRRNVIALDISHANVTENEVADALYGSLAVIVGPNPSGGAFLAGTTRKDDGFFRSTTRVQAVVTTRRFSNTDSLTTVWTVFPTTNPDATDPFTTDELQRFGNISTIATDRQRN